MAFFNVTARFEVGLFFLRRSSCSFQLENLFPEVQDRSENEEHTTQYQFLHCSMSQGFYATAKQAKFSNLFALINLVFTFLSPWSCNKIGEIMKIFLRPPSKYLYANIPSFLCRSCTYLRKTICSVHCRFWKQLFSLSFLRESNSPAITTQSPEKTLGGNTNRPIFRKTAYLARQPLNKHVAIHQKASAIHSSFIFNRPIVFFPQIILWG